MLVTQNLCQDCGVCWVGPRKCARWGERGHDVASIIRRVKREARRAGAAQALLGGIRRRVGACRRDDNQLGR
jgi:hypothetical protein